MNTPRARLLDPDFKYVPASQTNIRATFARIRREQKQAEEAAAKKPANVKPLRKAAK